MKDRVSIIILNWNGWKDTIECLESLYKIDYQNYEVIVVDNGSANESLKKIRAWAKKKLTNKKLLIIENDKNYGFAEGNNIAIREILKEKKSDYILFLNNDTVVKKDFLTKSVDLMKDHKVGVVGSNNRYYYNPEKSWYMGGKFYYYLGGFIKQTGFFEPKKPMDVDYACGSSMLIRTDLLRKYKLFFNNKYFCYFEDTDLCFKIRKKGYRVLYQPKSIIYHKVGASIVMSKNYTYYLTRNRIWFVKENYNLPQFILFTVSFFVLRFPIIFVKSVYSQTLTMFFRGLIDGYKKVIIYNTF